jgi:hypothetical protein
MLRSSKFKVQSLKLKAIVVFCLLSFVFFSCGGDKIDGNETSQNDSLATINKVIGEAQIIEPIADDEKVVLEKDGITLTEVKAENNKNAAIELTNKQFKEGINKLNFNVTGVADYEVAYLANNYTLTKFSDAIFDVELMYGNNVFLAFLIDKEGIGIKTNKGSVLKNAVLGDMESLFDMSQPHLFYYLPQTSGVSPILDFYLVNTSIGKGGNKVKVTINQTEFIINKWAAYQISGLPKADNKIRIQLIDKNGKLINGPFNDSGDRVFNLVNKSS